MRPASGNGGAGKHIQTVSLSLEERFVDGVDGGDFAEAGEACVVERVDPEVVRASAVGVVAWLGCRVQTLWFKSTKWLKIAPSRICLAVLGLALILSL